MSGWHRDNPELVGTDADPWMAIPAHRAAHEQVQQLEREQAFARRHGKSLDAMIAEAEDRRDSAMCECGHRYDEHDADPPGGGHCELCECERHEEAVDEPPERSSK